MLRRSSWVACGAPMQLHPAGRRPTAKGEKRKAGRRERIQHKRLRYTGSRAPVQLQRSTYQRRCNGADVTRRCRRGTNSRALHKGRSPGVYYCTAATAVVAGIVSADAIWQCVQLRCVLWQRVVPTRQAATE